MENGGTKMNREVTVNNLTDIIRQVKSKITDDSDMVWTHYDSAKQLRDELESYIRELENRDMRSMQKIMHLFSSPASLQEHSISNGWAEEYLVLAESLDNLYSKINHG